MINFTLDELADFSANEEQLINEIMGKRDENALLCPRKQVTDNILNYSRSLSVRNLKIMGKISTSLN